MRIKSKKYYSLVAHLLYLKMYKMTVLPLVDFKLFILEKRNQLYVQYYNFRLCIKTNRLLFKMRTDVYGYFSPEPWKFKCVKYIK